MLEGKVLICKHFTIDGFATSAVASRGVSSLAHEIWDHTVESTSLEMKRLPRLARALLASAQAAEVLSSLWSHIRAQLHHDAAGSAATDGDVKEDLRVGHDAERLLRLSTYQ